MIDLKYRPEIDGLRALAVILVLLFHADLGFSGGFIGVDVFFVISGFLITGLILKKQRAGTFRLSDFWMRRIRRIVPASVAMVVFTLVVGSLILMPLDYEKLAKTAFYHQLMASNIYLWRHTGYFDGPAEMKPLLHTWSLSVEEQFYLFYPFLLLWLGRFREAVRFRVLLGLCLVSLVGSEVMVRADQPAAFFLLPARAWELLLGGLICFLPDSKSVPRSIAEVLSILTLIGIGVCGWCYHDAMRFPGLLASGPCLATAAFIYLNSGSLTGAGRLLSSKPVVFVGLISYSLYLVHWPILVFLHYEYGFTLSTSTRIFALLLSFFLAVLSCRYVERPFRTGAILQTPQSLMKGAIAAPVALLLVTFLIEEWEGVPQRLPRNAQTFMQTKSPEEYIHLLKTEQIRGDDVPVMGDLDGTHQIAVWGDSHARCTMPAIDRLCREWHIKCYQLTNPGTAPLLDYTPTSYARKKINIPERNEAVLAFLKRKNISLVVMTAYWSVYEERQPEKFRLAVKQTFQRLNDEGISVVLLEDVARHNYEVAPYLTLQAWRGKNVEELGVSLQDHYARNRNCRRLFRESSFPNIRVYDPTPYFTNGDDLWPAQIEGVSMFTDDNHLSVSGSMRLLPLFQRSFLESAPQLAADPARTLH